MIITIPFYVLAIIFIIYLAVSFVFILVNYSHLIKTASVNLFSLIFSILSTLGIIVVLVYTFSTLDNIEWNNTLTIFDVNWFGAVFNF